MVVICTCSAFFFLAFVFAAVFWQIKYVYYIVCCSFLFLHFFLPKIFNRRKIAKNNNDNNNHKRTANETKTHEEQVSQKVQTAEQSVMSRDGDVTGAATFSPAYRDADSTGQYV